MFGQYNTTGDVQIQNQSSAGIIALATNNIERMRINSSGNVSIGQMATNFKFTTYGTIASQWITPNAEEAGFVMGDTALATAGMWFGNTFSSNNGAYLLFKTRDPTSAAVIERLRIDSSGNVSIGAVSTVSKLNVTGLDNLHMYLKQNNTDNGWILGTSSVDGVFRVQRRGEGASPTNNERFSVQPDGQMFHNSTYLLASSYNCYYGKSTSGGNTIVSSGFTNTGLSVANVYIPTNVRKVLMWFHVTLRNNGLSSINHTGFRIKMVRNSDSSTSYIGNSSWGIGISQGINSTQSQNWTVCSQFVNLYDYDSDGNGAGITAGTTYTFYLMANDGYATGSVLRIGSEGDGTHQTYTPQHAIIWVI